MTDAVSPELQDIEQFPLGELTGLALDLNDDAAYADDVETLQRALSDRPKSVYCEVGNLNNIIKLYK